MATDRGQEYLALGDTEQELRVYSLDKLKLDYFDPVKHLYYDVKKK